MDNFELPAGLRLVPVEAQHRRMLAEWIAADPDHRELTTVDFFATSGPGEECYLLEDVCGPLFFLKVTRAVRLDIQFSPRQDRAMRDRVRTGLVDGFAWLAGILEARGFREVIFNSRNELLKRSMEKRLGFVRSAGELVRRLAGKDNSSVRSIAAADRCAGAAGELL